METKNCHPSVIMTNSNHGGLERVKNFFRSPFDEDSMIEIKKHINFPRRQNIFNEDKRVWPAYDNQQLFSVYRFAGNPVIIERDDDSIVCTDDNNLANNIPYNPERLAKGKKVAKKCQQYLISHNIPMLSNVILFPDNSMSFDFVQSVDDSFWVNKRAQSGIASVDLYRQQPITRSGSVENLSMNIDQDPLEKEYSPESDLDLLVDQHRKIQRTHIEGLAKTRSQLVQLLKSKGLFNHFDYLDNIGYESQYIIRRLEKHFSTQLTVRDKLRLLQELTYIARGFRRNDLLKVFLKLEVQVTSQVEI